MIKQNELLRPSVVVTGIVMFFARLMMNLDTLFPVIKENKLFLFGGIGLVSLALGLFYFKKTLSYAFTLSGLYCAFYVVLRFNIVNRFFITAIALALVFVALYLFVQKNKDKGQ